MLPTCLNARWLQRRRHRVKEWWLVGVADGAIAYAKGHGTQNDFILLPDPDAELDLTANRVRALTDRRRGLGADGVLRVVPTIACPEVADQASRANWFMDYRNADGSVAEMCGNGARLFARFLVDRDWETTPSFRIATRGGVREVEVSGESVAVEMGPANTTGYDGPVTVTVAQSHFGAVGVGFPNPHVVVFVDDLAVPGDLLVAPTVLPVSAYPDGVNVEFVAVADDNHVAFRVFERGVGETRSCGTGACAVGWALRRSRGVGDPTAPLAIDVLGGRLRVHERADGHWVLDGPTTMVADGAIGLQWWKDNA